MKEKTEYQLYKETLMGVGKTHNRVYIQAILDPNMDTRSLAIYLALVKMCKYKTADKSKQQYRISSSNIQEVTGIVNSNQVKSIKKLISLGYITRSDKRSKGGYKYSVLQIKKAQFLALSDDDFNELSNDRDQFRSLLTLLALSNGNDNLPTIEEASKKLKCKRMSSSKYDKLKKLRRQQSDLELHEKLSNKHSIKATAINNSVVSQEGWFVNVSKNINLKQY